MKKYFFLSLFTASTAFASNTTNTESKKTPQESNKDIIEAVEKAPVKIQKHAKKTITTTPDTLEVTTETLTDEENLEEELVE